MAQAEGLRAAIAHQHAQRVAPRRQIQPPEMAHAAAAHLPPAVRQVEPERFGKRRGHFAALGDRVSVDLDAGGALVQPAEQAGAVEMDHDQHRDGGDRVRAVSGERLRAHGEAQIATLGGAQQQRRDLGRGTAERHRRDRRGRRRRGAEPEHSGLQAGDQERDHPSLAGTSRVKVELALPSSSWTATARR